MLKLIGIFSVVSFRLLMQKYLNTAAFRLPVLLLNISMYRTPSYVIICIYIHFENGPVFWPTVYKHKIRGFLVTAIYSQVHFYSVHHERCGSL